MQPDITRTAVELTAALRERKITASELVEQAIHRTEIVSGTVNPIAVNLYERAREAAVVADQQLDAGTGGPLCGLPVTIKDSQWLAGVPCANGSHSLQDFIPVRSSAAVANLERAGAVIFAKTTCPELSLFGITDSVLYGRTSNPWNLERTPGGSSGGAGAAVATGLGPMSLGGDGGGSIRIPAAFCGIVGFKPSHGLVDRKPCFPSWEDLVAYGPMTRSVGDAKLMLSSLVPPRKRARYDTRSHANVSAHGLKIIVSEDLGFVPVDADVRERFQNLLNLLTDAGAELIHANPGLSSSARVWAISATHDAWKHHDEEAAAQGSIGEIAQNFIEFGSLFTDAEFKEAQKHRKEISRAYKRLFKEHGTNLMLTPTLGCEAFAHDRIHPERIEQTFIEPPWIDWAGFLYDANLAGFPACALPMGVGDEGLPVSAQVLGAKGADADVLDAAEAIESLLGWYHPHAV